MTLTKRAAFATALVSFWAGGAALAHHGFTGRYDAGRPLWLSGQVTAVSAAPPHATITLRVDAAPSDPLTTGLPVEMLAPPRVRAEDSGQSRTVEFAPVSQFFAIGGKVKPGDRVEIIALRNCQPPHQLRSQWLRLSTGEIVERTGRLSYMVPSC
jgi:hypothetical protein